ncbi:MAG TPA: hypothetical protein VK588_04640, partial [Chitinophagaceae bacterium]|nr:hypothetical protein [Chitinophagaceae bacterium]
MRNQRKFILSILCGGPSLERGISLNSARCVLDHLEDDAVEIVPFYFDHNKNSFKISKAQLYSNTPSDFDFKLKQTAKSLSKKDLIRELKKCDLCFPIIHGEMGEDGEIQKLLESENIPFIASPSQACNIAFHKFRTTEFLKQNGFYTIPSIIIKNSKTAISLETIKDFFGKINTSKVVVKPATGGSSIGVNIATSPNDVIKYSKEIFDRQLDTEVIVEPFIDGIEFTSIVLENPIGEPVSLIPIEIKTSYEDDSFFDFRKKYLPTHGTMYYQPPRFETKIISDIREQAEKIFKLMGLRDFARLDGWVLNTGEIFFSDINPISGMEQNSFLFQAGARINFSHKDLLHYIIKNACWRYKLIPPKKLITKGKKKVVNVLFGGATSERQVSLMSGTNIIFKLKRSKKYEPVPFLLDQNNMVWELPYSFILSHTVEEIIENIQHASEIKNKVEPFKRKIYQSLRVGKDDTHEAFFLPRKFSLSTFIKKSKF